MNRNNKSNQMIYKIIPAGIIMIGVIIMIFILSSSTNKETEVVLSDKTIQVKGMFGTSCDYGRITSIELKDTMPAITRKNNGSALGSVKKGKFEVEGMGECRLYLMSEDGPFLYIKADNEYVIINYVDKNKTVQLYNDLCSKTGK